ncbi:MAG: HD domain-containing protein [Ignavibacteriales bacterium]
MAAEKRIISNASELIEVIRESPQYKALADKTQIVFSFPDTENVLNRQTHTEEVAKISAKIARGLGEDEALAELMGLCHDLGHTPFGHDGEYAINEIARNCGYSASHIQDYYNQNNPQNSFSISHIRTLSQDLPEVEEGSKGQIESSFEHHEHSLRELNNILDSQNIELDYDLKAKLMSGILCHSESRETTPKERIVQIPRISDKFYAFTDLSDMINCGVKVDVRAFFENMSQKGCFPVKQKNSEEMLYEPSEEDLLLLEQIAADAESRPDFLDIYREKYVEDIVSASKNSDKVDVSNNMRRTMEYLKALAKYMRQEMIIEKEEGLAQRMVNEVWAYMAENIRIEKYLPNGMKANKEIEAAFLTCSLTDNAVIDMFKYISQSREWVARVGRGEVKINPVDEKKPYDEQQVHILRQRPEIVRYMNIEEEYKHLRDVRDKGKAPAEVTSQIDSLGSRLQEFHQLPHKNRALDRLKIKKEILDINDSLGQEKAVGQTPSIKKHLHSVGKGR